MKRFVLLLLSVVAMSAYGQEIKKNEVDEFTGAQVIETSWEKVVWQMKPDMCMYARFRIVNGREILDIKCMRNNPLVVTPDDPIMFLDENKASHKFYPTDTFMGGKGQAAVKVMEQSSWGIYIHYKGNFSFLLNSAPLKLRWYTSEGYIDGEIKKKHQKNLPELYRLAKEAASN